MRKTVLTYLACIVVLVLVACPLLIRDFMQAAQTLPQDCLLYTSRCV